MIDYIRYELYSRGEHCLILYDKIENNFAIHSKDEDNDVGIITGFATASDAINFADTRVVALEKDSKVIV